MTSILENKKLAQIIFGILFLVSLFLIYFYLDQLPEKLATHFDFNGKADGYSEKSTFVILYLLLIVGITSTFFFCNWLIYKMPSLINIHNQKYWLAEERKEETLSIISSYLYWIGNLTFLLLLFIYRSIIITNISGADQIPGLESTLVYIAALILISIKLIKRFKKLPE